VRTALALAVVAALTTGCAACTSPEGPLSTPTSSTSPPPPLTEAELATALLTAEDVAPYGWTPKEEDEEISSEGFPPCELGPLVEVRDAAVASASDTFADGAAGTLIALLGTFAEPAAEAVEVYRSTFLACPVTQTTIAGVHAELHFSETAVPDLGDDAFGYRAEVFVGGVLRAVLDQSVVACGALLAEITTSTAAALPEPQRAELLEIAVERAAALDDCVG